MENLSEVKKAVDSVPPEGKAKAKTIVKAEASGGKSPAKAGGKGGGQVSKSNKAVYFSWTLIRHDLKVSQNLSTLYFNSSGYT